MANAVTVNSCGLCQIPMDAGNPPEVIKCARGHAFHKKCVVVPPYIYPSCPVERCGEPFTAYTKSLGNRLAESLLIDIGFSDGYEQAVREFANEHGISDEYAHAVLTEIDFLKMCLKEIPATFLDILSSRLFWVLVGAIFAYYGWPILRDYFQQ